MSGRGAAQQLTKQQHIPVVVNDTDKHKNRKAACILKSELEIGPSECVRCGTWEASAQA